MIKEVTSTASVRYTHILNVTFQLKNQPPQQGWMQNPPNTPGASSSSETYIDVPPHMPHGLTEHDLSAIFNPSLQQDLPKPDVLAQLIDRLVSDRGPSELDWASPDRVGLGHCGCANETNSYIVLLELSFRLRKASEVVGHHFKHFSGSTCALNERIIELDRFISCVKFTNNQSWFYGLWLSQTRTCGLQSASWVISFPRFPSTSSCPHARHSFPLDPIFGLAHSPISGTPMPITPTGHNYSQPPMRPTLP